MKLTLEQEHQLRELRSQAALLGHVINSQEFHEAAALAIRKMMSCKCDIMQPNQTQKRNENK